jgi:Protein of unknown function (DUF3142)
VKSTGILGRSLASRSIVLLTLRKIALPAVAAIFCAWAALFAFHPLPRTLTGDAAAPPRFVNLPRIILWAWERPEDLLFLQSQPVGVAFLAQTITLQSASRQFTVRPRLQPLRLAPSTPLVAVVRIESPTAIRNSTPPILTPEAREQVATQIANLQALLNVRAIQIDFDATTTQHAFYSALLQDVRRKLPSTFPLSITALASWCIGDRWLTELPANTIDEAVPMLFRMGPDTVNVAHFLRSREQFPVPACRTSVGLSTDETLSHQLLTKQISFSFAPPSEKRIYVFAPRPWTQSIADPTLKEWQQ